MALSLGVYDALDFIQLAEEVYHHKPMMDDHDSQQQS
jgi:hypothetical protein